jgi:hypothetical protein
MPGAKAVEGYEAGEGRGEKARKYVLDPRTEIFLRERKSS